MNLQVLVFLPEKLMQYLKDLSKFPTGYSYLPEFQYFRGLDNDINLSINDTDKRLSEVNEHTIHVGRIGDQTGTRGSNTTAQSSLVPVSKATI